MGHQEAIQEYTRAQKAGQKYYKAAVLNGRYPYPQVLDEIVDENMAAGRVDLGLVEIPTDQIIGTKTAGRKAAFAGNFMPLLSPQSEFGMKWARLCEAHLGEEGIRDPIRCYEYLGKFYVQEGNKRVSVLKYYDAPTIPGYVIRIIPNPSPDIQVQIYYEFLDFYRLTHLYQVNFDQLGSYQKLQAALGYEPDYIWSVEERSRFLSGFSRFREAFSRLGGDELRVTPAGALLVWLKIYPFENLKEMTAAELDKSLTAVWADIKLLAQDAPIAVSTAPESSDRGLLARLFDNAPNHLNVAFVHAFSPEESAWTRAHDLGRMDLERALKDKVTVKTYLCSGGNVEEVMEQAVNDGAQVLFATTPPLIGACRKLAARYPEVRILNCSLSMPYTGIRTYYSRIYEGKFITGAIAGAMAKEDKIGYVANYPIFGVPAGINAFALGARLTNPRARIQLHWSCTPGNPRELFAAQGISVISNLDIPSPSKAHQAWEWGTYQLQEDGGLRPLASPKWEWGMFYEKVCMSIMDGSWDAYHSKDAQKAVNYWWGMDSGVIDVELSSNLPDGVRRMAMILKRELVEGILDPFYCKITDQEGIVRNDGTRWFSPEEILNMDWLCQWVDGDIPSYEELLPVSQNMVRLLGLYRDQIPPEKEDVIL